MRRPANTISARRRWRGSAMLEFAAVVPVLVLLAGLSVEFGRVLYTYNTLTKAVHSATRRLAMTSNTSATNAAWIQAQQEACRLAVYGTLTGGSTPLVPGLTPSKVLLSNSGMLIPSVFSGSGTGCGVTCGISTVKVTISDYRLASMFGNLLPSSVLHDGQMIIEPIKLTMRSWPFATTTPVFGQANTSCAALI